jgi:predicted N-acetyltransferase YhbS
MLHIRPMTAADLSLGLRLAEQAGWNQTQADWQRFLRLDPQGGFVAEWLGQPVGTVTTFLFGHVAWIATVLVDEPFRRQGIGTRLVQHALAHLDEHGVSTVRLDATEFGRPIYERFGFTPGYELARFEGRAGRCPGNHAVQPLVSDLTDAAIELDRRVTGTDRRCLLEELFQQTLHHAWAFVDGDELIGYATVRRGRRAYQIGPAAAVTNEAGRELLDQTLLHCEGERVFVDIPHENRMALAWAENRGLRRQRRFVRMSRGDPVPEQPSQMWATSGPEKG